jgi:hypothetical protein
LQRFQRTQYRWSVYSLVRPKYFIVHKMKPGLIGLELLALTLMSCGPSMTLMVHPITGERVICRAGLNQYGAPVAQNLREDCVQQFSAAGFVPATQLTNTPKLVVGPTLPASQTPDTGTERIQLELERQKGIQEKPQAVKVQPKINNENWSQCMVDGPLNKSNTRQCLKDNYGIDVPEQVWESCRASNRRVARDCVVKQGY